MRMEDVFDGRAEGYPGAVPLKNMLWSTSTGESNRLTYMYEEYADVLLMKARGKLMKRAPPIQEAYDLVNEV